MEPLHKMKRILVVDDEKLIREGIQEALSEEGYTVFAAANGNEAIKAMQVFIPDVIITDIIMPEADGIEVLMNAKKLQPKPRIIAISGGGRISANDHLATARKLGADYILTKPFSIETLLEAIESQ